MKHRIRPAEEEIGFIFPVLAFSVLWYGSLLRIVLSGGIRSVTLLLFFAAGLIPLYTVVMNIRRAFFYRKQRADAITLGHREHGRIRAVTRQDVPYVSSSHNRNSVRYRRYYYLQVDMTDSATGVVQTIQSQGYRKPIHRYLRSDKVSVYTDKSGWKYYLEDFEWKQNRSDPDIFDTPREFEELHMGSGIFIQAVFVILMILMMIEFLFR